MEFLYPNLCKCLIAMGVSDIRLADLWTHNAALGKTEFYLKVLNCIQPSHTTLHRSFYSKLEGVEFSDMQHKYFINSGKTVISHMDAITLCDQSKPPRELRNRTMLAGYSKTGLKLYRTPVNLRRNLGMWYCLMHEAKEIATLYQEKREKKKVH